MRPAGIRPCLRLQRWLGEQLRIEFGCDLVSVFLQSCIAPHPTPTPTPTAVFEVFSTGWTWQVHREWLDQEQRPQLQWWALTVQVSPEGAEGWAVEWGGVAGRVRPASVLGKQANGRVGSTVLHKPSASQPAPNDPVCPTTGPRRFEARGAGGQADAAPSPVQCAARRAGQAAS